MCSVSWKDTNTRARAYTHTHTLTLHCCSRTADEPKTFKSMFRRTHRFNRNDAVGDNPVFSPRSSARKWWETSSFVKIWGGVGVNYRLRPSLFILSSRSSQLWRNASYNRGRVLPRWEKSGKSWPRLLDHPKLVRQPCVQVSGNTWGASTNEVDFRETQVKSQWRWPINTHYYNLVSSCMLSLSLVFMLCFKAGHSIQINFIHTASVTNTVWPPNKQQLLYSLPDAMRERRVSSSQHSC